MEAFSVSRPVVGLDSSRPRLGGSWEARLRFAENWPLGLRLGETGAVQGSLSRRDAPGSIRSRAEASGPIERTCVDLVGGRALAHHEAALRQYLALRLGEVAAAREAFIELRARLATGRVERLTAPPGLRPRLFREARRIAKAKQEASSRPPGAVTRAVLPWRRPQGWAVGESLRLDRLRFELRPEEVELVELHYARGLTLSEMAFVLEQPLDAVRRLLDRAAERAVRLLAAGGEEPALERLAPLAFALDAGAIATTQRLEAGPAPLEEGLVVGGRYAIVERVGTGAFGDVYRAVDTEVPGHVVALKLLHTPSRTPEERQDALRELRLIAAVFHPSIVQFKDHGWYEERLWFVMPWYEGETLAERVRRGPLSREEARRIFEPLARGLAALHAAGIRHQDVKPDNVLLARIRGFGEDEVLPVLIDLGVAATDSERLVAGTPFYFAPEVAARFAEGGKPSHVDGRADVFALALALCHALDPSTRPEVPPDQVDRFVAERARTRPPLPGGRALRDLRPHFARWMSLDPEERPDANTFAEELAVLTAPAERRERRRRVLRWLVPAALASTAVFAATVYALHTRAERQRLEAERARVEQAALQQDLARARAQERRLARDVAEAKARYEQSKMSRAQLAERLAGTERELFSRSEALRRAEQREASLRDELESLHRRLEEKQNELEEARRAVRRQEEEIATRERLLRERSSELEELRGRLGAQAQELEAVRRRLEQARARLEAAEANVAAERARAETLSERLRQVIAERDAARRRLEATAPAAAPTSGRGEPGSGAPPSSEHDEAAPPREPGPSSGSPEPVPRVP